MNPHIHRWHRLVETRDYATLDDLLDDGVVFHSPVVHTPQRGKAITKMYLAGALQVLGNTHFRYVREIGSTTDVLLEFESEVDGIHVNGVDLIRFNADGRIVDFKVMLRPWKAMEAVKLRMAAMLQMLAAGAGKAG
ncbi:MAG TPA: nuclear transport factor 2 family protein [Solimonas sp.]|nr:nuclear transport factor 2 family protein [Solimonas sp.]